MTLSRRDLRLQVGFTVRSLSRLMRVSDARIVLFETEHSHEPRLRELYAQFPKLLEIAAKGDER
jgi:hypothetical protein